MKGKARKKWPKEAVTGIQRLLEEVRSSNPLSMLGRLVWFVLPATFSRFVVPTTFLGRFVVPTLFLNVGLSMAEQPVEEERNMAQEALRTSLGVFYGPFGM